MTFGGFEKCANDVISLAFPVLFFSILILTRCYKCLPAKKLMTCWMERLMRPSVVLSKILHWTLYAGDLPLPKVENPDIIFPTQLVHPYSSLGQGDTKILSTLCPTDVNWQAWFFLTPVDNPTWPPVSRHLLDLLPTKNISTFPCSLEDIRVV